MCDLFDYLNNAEIWKISGERIKKRRKDLKIGSQEQLANLIGVTKQTVIDLEKGHIPIKRIYTLASLARILKVDPEYITCQCDTLRKENENIVSVTGLSERAIEILKSHNEVFSPVCETVSGLIEHESFFEKLTSIKVVYHRKHFSVMADILSREYDKILPDSGEGKEAAIAGIRDWYSTIMTYYAKDSLLYGAEYDLYMELKKYIEQ